MSNYQLKYQNKELLAHIEQLRFALIAINSEAKKQGSKSKFAQLVTNAAEQALLKTDSISTGYVDELAESNEIQTLINLCSTEEQAEERFRDDIEQHIVVCDIGDYWKNSDLSDFDICCRAGRLIYDADRPYGNEAVFQWQESGALHSICVNGKDLVVIVGGAPCV